MNAIRSALLSGAKRELNALFTEAPRTYAGGLDPGWFCREHALFVSVLAEMLGEKVQICWGDLVFAGPGEKYPMAMVESGKDHFWCRVEEIAPIDASVTFSKLDPSREDVVLIVPSPPELRNGIELKYSRRLERGKLLSSVESRVALLHYNEQERKTFSALSLLADPYRLLINPGNGPNLLQSHGEEIFYSLAAHLFKVATGESSGIADLGLAWGESMRIISERITSPREMILAQLSGTKA